MLRVFENGEEIVMFVWVELSGHIPTSPSLHRQQVTSHLLRNTKGVEFYLV